MSGKLNTLLPVPQMNMTNLKKFRNSTKKQNKTSLLEPPEVNRTLESKKKNSKKKNSKKSTNSIKLEDKRLYRKESNDYYLIEDLYKYIDKTKNDKVNHINSEINTQTDIKMIPKGTLLYTYISYKKTEQIPADKLLIQDYLRTMFNITYDKIRNVWEICLSSKDNSYKYYYAAPLVSHGVAGYGYSYNMCIPSITNRDLYFSYLKSSRHSNQDQSSLHRNPLKWLDYTNSSKTKIESDYYERCDNDKTKTNALQCGREGNDYDVCLSNKNRKNRQIDGIIAIASSDSQAQLESTAIPNEFRLNPASMSISLQEIKNNLEKNNYTDKDKKYINDLIVSTIPIIEADRRIHTVINKQLKKSKTRNNITSIGCSEYTIPAFGWLADKLITEIKNEEAENEKETQKYIKENQTYKNNNVNYKTSIFKDLNNSTIKKKNKITDYITNKEFNKFRGYSIYQYKLTIDDNELNDFINKYLDKYIAIKPIGLITENFGFDCIKNKPIVFPGRERQIVTMYDNIIYLNINVKKYLDTLDMSYNTNKQLYHLNDENLASSYYKKIKCEIKLKDENKDVFNPMFIINKTTETNTNPEKNTIIPLYKIIENKSLASNDTGRKYFSQTEYKKLVDDYISLSSFSIKITKDIEFNIVKHVIYQQYLTAYKFMKQRENNGRLVKTEDEENTINIFYDNENKNIITSNPFFQPYNSNSYNSDSDILKYTDNLLDILELYLSKPLLDKIKEYITELKTMYNKKVIFVGTIEKDKDTKLMETSLDIDSNIVYEDYLTNYKKDKGKSLPINLELLKILHIVK
jgi:hypothetical protein